MMASIHARSNAAGLCEFTSVALTPGARKAPLPNLGKSGWSLTYGCGWTAEEESDPVHPERSKWNQRGGSSRSPFHVPAVVDHTDLRTVGSWEPWPLTKNVDVYRGARAPRA